MKKDIPQPLIRMDEETKQLLQARANAHGLSESGYIKMLIRQDAGLNTKPPSGRTKKTIEGLYRDLFKTDRYDDSVDTKNFNEKKLLHAVNGLVERQRQFVLERYIEGLTLDQIGKRNGLGKESVRRTIERAKIILKRNLGPR